MWRSQQVKRPKTTGNVIFRHASHLPKTFSYNLSPMYQVLGVCIPAPLMERFYHQWMLTSQQVKQPKTMGNVVFRLASNLLNFEDSPLQLGLPWNKFWLTLSLSHSSKDSIINRCKEGNKLSCQKQLKMLFSGLLHTFGRFPPTTWPLCTKFRCPYPCATRQKILSSTC